MLDPTIAALIRERIGDQRFGVFFSVGEGDFMPNGEEDSSGHVVTEDGRHYTFWTAWNPVRQVVELGWWYAAEPSPEDLASWRESDEYRAACAEAGWEPRP